MKRLATNYFTIAANTNEQIFEFDTEDDYRVRHVKSVFVGLATAGVKLGLYVSGQLYSTVDLSRFAAGDSVLYVEFDAPASMPVKVAFTDTAGAGHANVPVVLGYDVDAGTGP